ncbi:MAG: CPP1-like family protein [Leptolyngbyaceae cyanobacterium]|uniref:CPP1-like family protein n=1 Tax=Leptodesmis TaxID=2664261 RepID=UPI001F42E3A5|nr:CPP1-like family protein [Leptodesmis sichuanensis]UIE39232.1 CPP1-like family protein [Leptodesmis sichuanensis A121]
MSEQNPYDQLGVTEDSSFDEIQAARNRLCAEFNGDAEQVKKIEAAYDAVLMDRLRMRQEGKIKVPEGIRFPERVVEPSPSPVQTVTSRSPQWLQRLIDTPSRMDILLPAGVFAGLAALVIFVPTAVQLGLIVGVGSAFYFLYRKEQKLGRAVLLGFAGLIVGLLLGGGLFSLLENTLVSTRVTIDAFASTVTFLALWLISSFLR